MKYFICACPEFGIDKGSFAYYFTLKNDFFNPPRLSQNLRTISLSQLLISVMHLLKTTSLAWTVITLQSEKSSISFAFHNILKFSKVTNKAKRDKKEQSKKGIKLKKNSEAIHEPSLSC
jgi:hypothetical protein